MGYCRLEEEGPRRRREKKKRSWRINRDRWYKRIFDRQGLGSSRGAACTTAIRSVDRSKPVKTRGPPSFVTTPVLGSLWLFFDVILTLSSSSSSFAPLAMPLKKGGGGRGGGKEGEREEEEKKGKRRRRGTKPRNYIFFFLVGRTYVVAQPSSFWSNLSLSLLLLLSRQCYNQCGNLASLKAKKSPGQPFSGRRYIEV